MSEAAPSVQPAPGADRSVLSRISFSEISGWRDDDHAAAHRAFLTGALLIAESAPKTRRLGIDGVALQIVARAAIAEGDLDRQRARKFFERWFLPYRIEASGFVTGYYEPEVEASRERKGRFTVPLYRRPADLVEVSEAER